MHTTVIKTVQNRIESAELGLMLAQAEGVDEPLAALYDSYFMYTMAVEETPFTGVLSRFDMPDGKHFYALALTCDGIDSYISSHATVGLMLKHELQLESEDTVIKSKHWDSVCEQLDLKNIRVIFLDEARRFIGDARDSTALARYAEYILMEHAQKQENKDV